MPLALPESRVLEIWQASLQERSDLVTEENEPIRIVYPGRLNDDRGADLRDAVIVTGRGMLRGDIEIHVKSSSWWAHRHHEDPAYNRVILHVVYWDDAGKELVLQNGVRVPTLALHGYAGKQPDPAIHAYTAPPAPCRRFSHKIPPGTAVRILEEAGDARFLSRTDLFRQAIIREGAGQVLYESIMTALGYSKNKEAMAELASAAPLKRLEALITRAETEKECLAQVQPGLLGKAGLLPSQRGIKYDPDNPADAWIEQLENTWKTSGDIARMSAEDWRFFKVRPGNYPVRRIAAMSYLLIRYRETGLLEGLKNIIEEAEEDNWSTLEQSLLVGPEGFWGWYLDFGLPVRGILPALLGRARAAELVVNALLPFTAAYARLMAQPRLEEKALNIYRNYPAPVENSLEKHMRKQLGMGPCQVNTARRRQGLLHIYKTRCTQGKCNGCPLRR